MVIRISESGKLLHVEYGIREFFCGIGNPWPWNSTIGILNPLPGIRNLHCGLQNPSLSRPVFFVSLVQFNRVVQRLEIITKFRAQMPDVPFSSFLNRKAIFMWLVLQMEWI